MSKSVLVIDTPESCCSCYLCGFTLNLQYCRGKLKDIKDTSTKPDWCPLKPLPKKKEERDWRSKLSLEWVRGWNTCISKITGGNADD